MLSAGVELLLVPAPAPLFAATVNWYDRPGVRPVIVAGEPVTVVVTTEPSVAVARMV